MDRLGDFIYIETLSSNTLAKSAHFLGTIDGENAVVSVTRSLPKAPVAVTEIKLLEKNGIYSWGLANWAHNLESDPSVKIDVIWPATDVHIAKYREQPVRTVVETPAMYATLVKPFIESMRGDRLDWVRAILYDGAEADQVLYKHDNKFLLLPNQRWDRQTLDSLYLMVLFYDDKLASIRDLNGTHIPFLRDIQNKVLEVCYDKYGLQSHELKLYFHYHPSYYQMHIHVAHVGLQQLDFGRSILVDNVIDMLEARPEGLHKATISYILGQGHKLAKIFLDAGV